MPTRAALLAAVVLALAAPSGRAWGAAATFVPPGGSSLTVNAQDVDGKVFLSVNDIVAVLGGTLELDAATRSFELKASGRTAVFGVETTVAVVDTRIVQLATPVRVAGPVAFAEADFYQKVIAPLYGVIVVWDAKARTLIARRVEVPEVSVETSVQASEGTTKVVFRFSQLPAHKVEKGDDQVVIRISGARLLVAATEKPVDDPRVARLLLRPTEVAVVLKSRNVSTNVYTLESPARIVVDVTRVAAPGPGAPPPSATPAPGVPGALRPPAPPEPKTIVLDAGHGGTEEGAKGPDGTLEKDATLALVKTIKETLVKRGYRVVTTRDSDVSVGFDDRAAIANAAKADAFLSIHLNASRASGAHGTEVYYLSLDASDRAAAALAASENSPVSQVTPTAESNAALRDLDLILWDLAQNQHLSSSSRLADFIQADFNRLLGIATRGVKQAPFRVLIGVNAPAVLVEVAFITNPEEEKKLVSDEFRQQVAETLAGSLETYFRSADGAAPVTAVPLPNGRR